MATERNGAQPLYKSISSQEMFVIFAGWMRYNIVAEAIIFVIINFLLMAFRKNIYLLSEEKNGDEAAENDRPIGLTMRRVFFLFG